MAWSTRGLLTASIPTVIRAIGLPRVDSLNCTLKVDGKFYAVVTIGGERKETRVARSSSTPAWNQLFSLYECRSIFFFYPRY